MLFRVETPEGKEPPYGNDHRLHPRVCRVRNLLADAPLRVLYEDGEFNVRVREARALPDGSVFFLEGIHDGPDDRYQGVRAIDAVTGTERWRKRYPQVKECSSPILDPSGQLLAFPSNLSPDGRVLLVNSASGEPIAPLLREARGLAPEARYLIHSHVPTQGLETGGSALHRRGDKAPLLVLGIDTVVSSLLVFDRQGQRIAWCNSHGTVTVCDLERIRSRLKEVGLDWD